MAAPSPSKFCAPMWKSALPLTSTASVLPRGKWNVSLQRASACARSLPYEMLEQSMKLELDLRMEASALAEMAENTKDDPGFRLPTVDWQTTSKRVLTTEWIDGTPMADVEALLQRGLDLIALGDTVIQSFLRHAIRDGFFHADMHQGNLMVDATGNLVALDLGIMGRLGVKERLFLAEILYGFITRDYLRVAQVHFDAGYVPAHAGRQQFRASLARHRRTHSWICTPTRFPWRGCSRSCSR